MTRPRPVIAHVLHRLDRAGAEVLAAGLARSLRARFESIFLCLDALGPLADELAAEGFVVEALGRVPGIDRALGRRMRSLLKTHDAALLHAHQYTPFFYSALARGPLTRRLPGLPGRPGRPGRPGAILFTEHGRHYPDTRSTKRVLANKLLLQKRDRVTAVGSFVREALIRNEGIAPGRIQVVYNGIEPGPEPTPADRDQARQRLGIPPGRPVVMQVARFHPVKDHATALRAFAALRQTLGDTHDPLLVLVGDGDERQSIESLARSLDIHDAVRFTGAVDNARQLIPAADVCVLSSLSEGVSVTLLEAMAAAKPVVATDVGGNSEVVEHNVTGLLVPRGDAHALADQLIKLIFDPKRAARFAQAGRQRLLERFTARRMHDQYAQLYENLTGPPQA